MSYISDEFGGMSNLNQVLVSFWNSLCELRVKTTSEFLYKAIIQKVNVFLNRNIFKGDRKENIFVISPQKVKAFRMTRLPNKQAKTVRFLPGRSLERVTVYKSCCFEICRFMTYSARESAISSCKFKLLYGLFLDLIFNKLNLQLSIFQLSEHSQLMSGHSMASIQVECMCSTNKNKCPSEQQKTAQLWNESQLTLQIQNIFLTKTFEYK